MDHRRTPYNSIVSLRTFYAFGARSGRTPSLQRLSSYKQLTSRSISCNAYGRWSSQRFHSVDASVSASALSRSFTASSSLTMANQQPSAYQNRYNPSIHRHGARVQETSSAYHPPPFPSVSVRRQTYSRFAATFVELLRTQASPLPAHSSGITNSGDTMLHSSNTDEKHAYQKLSEVPIQQSIDTSSSSFTSSSSTSSHVAPNSTTPHIPTSSEPSPVKQSAEQLALQEKNTSLQAEIEWLKMLLKEKERSEKELKRKLLESAAEVKAWKKKYEMQKLKSGFNIIKEPKENNEEIGNIMDQLSVAADKLSRLNAVNDLKLLQTQMETALKEIS